MVRYKDENSKPYSVRLPFLYGPSKLIYLILILCLCDRACDVDVDVNVGADVTVAVGTNTDVDATVNVFLVVVAERAPSRGRVQEAQRTWHIPG